jgi:hypothetical protein
LPFVRECERQRTSYSAIRSEWKFFVPNTGRAELRSLVELSLPDSTWTRIARLLRPLQTFPLAGPEPGGRWAPTRFVVGPWSWMILLYRYEQSSDRVYVVAMDDGRSATSATAAHR